MSHMILALVALVALVLMLVTRNRSWVSCIFCLAYAFPAQLLLVNVLTKYWSWWAALSGAVAIALVIGLGSELLVRRYDKRRQARQLAQHATSASS